MKIDQISLGLPTQEDRDEKIAWAAENGHHVVFADPWTIMVDIDGEDALTLFWQRFDDYRRVGLGYMFVSVVESKTAGHYHGYIDLDRPMSRSNRINWQRQLGSDQLHECLNFAWLASGGRGDCFFVETEKAIDEVRNRPRHWIPRLLDRWYQWSR